METSPLEEKEEDKQTRVCFFFDCVVVHSETPRVVGCSAQSEMRRIVFTTTNHIHTFWLDASDFRKRILSCILPSGNGRRVPNCFPSLPSLETEPRTVAVSRDSESSLTSFDQRCSRVLQVDVALILLIHNTSNRNPLRNVDYYDICKVNDIDDPVKVSF